MYPILFIYHQLMAIGLFPLWAIVNNAIMYPCVQVTVWSYIFNYFGFVPRSGIPGSYSNSLFHLLRDCQTFSTVAAQFTSPSAVYECSTFSAYLPRCIIVCLFYCSHHHGYEVGSHCGFELHFPNDKLCWPSFDVLTDHLYNFFGEVSIWTLFQLKKGYSLFVVEF